MAANWLPPASYNPGKLDPERRQRRAAYGASCPLKTDEACTVYQHRLENEEERAERERKEAARAKTDDNVTPLANTKQALDFVLGRPGYARHDLVAMGSGHQNDRSRTFGPDERERMKAWIDGWQEQVAPLLGRE